MFDWYHSGGISYLFVNGDNIYAFSEEGMFLSKDEGNSWEKAVFNGIPDTLKINDIVANGNLMAAATAGAGVFVSNDNGLNWKSMNNGLYDTIKFKEYCDNELKKEKIDSSLKKMTRGVSDSDEWYAKILNDLKAKDVKKHMAEKLQIASIAISDKTIYIYRMYYGFSYSSNNGATWDSLPIDANYFVSRNNLITITADNKNIFAYTGDKIQRSQDRGKTWKKLHIEIPPDTAFIGVGDVVAYEDKEINTLSISGKTIYAGTTHGVFISYDEGEHWKEMNSGLPNKKPVTAFAIAGKTLFVCPGNYMGVFVSNDNGLNWKEFNKGFRHNTEEDYNCGYITYFAVSKKNIYAGVWTNGQCTNALWTRPLSDAEE